MQNDSIANNKPMNNSNDKELKDSILNINHEIMFNIGDMAVLELFQIAFSMKTSYNAIYRIIIELEKDGEYIRTLVEKTQNYDLIKKMVFGIKDIDEDVSMEYFQKIRDDIYEILHCITGYVTEIAYIKEISREILYKENVKQNYSDSIGGINTEKLYENVYDFLTKDMDELSHKIRGLVSVIPLKISRNKYYDIIKNAIEKDLCTKTEDDVNAILERYKLIFNGAMAVGYGQRFGKYFRKAHMLNQLSIEKLSLEDIKEVHKETSEILIEMNSIAELIRQIGYVANRHIILNIIGEAEYRFDKNKYNQIVKLWDEYVIEDNEKVEKKIMERCNIQIEILGKKIQEDSARSLDFVNDFSEKFGIIDNNTEENLTNIRKILYYMNDTSFENKDFIFLEGKQTVTSNYLEQAIENFLEFINRNIKNMSNKQRKVRMRRLLCLTEIPFRKPEDFFRYFKSSIETNTTKDELVANINLISEIMKKYSV